MAGHHHVEEFLVELGALERLQVDDGGRHVLLLLAIGLDLRLVGRDHCEAVLLGKRSQILVGALVIGDQGLAVALDAGGAGLLRRLAEVDLHLVDVVEVRDDLHVIGAELAGLVGRGRLVGGGRLAGPGCRVIGDGDGR
jgi:hypothetical protein